MERQLCAAWQQHQLTRAAAAAAMGMHGGAGAAGCCLGRAYTLSQRMLHFLQNFTYYMTLEVRGGASFDPVLKPPGFKSFKSST